MHKTIIKVYHDLKDFDEDVSALLTAGYKLCSNPSVDHVSPGNWACVAWFKAPEDVPAPAVAPVTAKKKG